MTQFPGTSNITVPSFEDLQHAVLNFKGQLVDLAQNPKAFYDSNFTYLFSTILASSITHIASDEGRIKNLAGRVTYLTSGLAFVLNLADQLKQENYTPARFITMAILATTATYAYHNTNKKDRATTTPNTLPAVATNVATTNPAATTSFGNRLRETGRRIAGSFSIASLQKRNEASQEQLRNLGWKWWPLKPTTNSASSAGTGSPVQPSLSPPVSPKELKGENTDGTPESASSNSASSSSSVAAPTTPPISPRGDKVPGASENSDLSRQVTTSSSSSAHSSSSAPTQKTKGGIFGGLKSPFHTPTTAEKEATAVAKKEKEEKKQKAEAEKEAKRKQAEETKQKQKAEKEAKKREAQEKLEKEQKPLPVDSNDDSQKPPLPTVSPRGQDLERQPSPVAPSTQGEERTPSPKTSPRSHTSDLTESTSQPELHQEQQSQADETLPEESSRQDHLVEENSETLGSEVDETASQSSTSPTVPRLNLGELSSTKPPEKKNKLKNIWDKATRKGKSEKAQTSTLKKGDLAGRADALNLKDTPETLKLSPTPKNSGSFDETITKLQSDRSGQNSPARSGQSSPARTLSQSGERVKKPGLLRSSLQKVSTRKITDLLKRIKKNEEPKNSDSTSEPTALQLAKKRNKQQKGDTAQMTEHFTEYRDEAIKHVGSFKAPTHIKEKEPLDNLMLYLMRKYCLGQTLAPFTRLDPSINLAFLNSVLDIHNENVIYTPTFSKENTKIAEVSEIKSENVTKQIHTPDSATKEAEKQNRVWVSEVLEFEHKEITYKATVNAVYEGINGNEVAKHAANETVAYLKDALRNQDIKDPVLIKKVMKGIFSHIHANMPTSVHGGKNLGATGAVVLELDNRIWTSTIGDGQAFIVYDKLEPQLENPELKELNAHVISLTDPQLASDERFARHLQKNIEEGKLVFRETVKDSKTKKKTEIITDSYDVTRAIGLPKHGSTPLISRNAKVSCLSLSSIDPSENRLEDEASENYRQTVNPMLYLTSGGLRKLANPRELASIYEISKANGEPVKTLCAWANNRRIENLRLLPQGATILVRELPAYNPATDDLYKAESAENSVVPSPSHSRRASISGLPEGFDPEQARLIAEEEERLNAEEQFKKIEAALTARESK